MGGDVARTGCIYVVKALFAREIETMKKKVLIGGLPVVVTLAFAIVFSGSVQGKVTKGDSRPLTTHTLMEKLVRPHCGAIGKGLKAEEVDWESLRASTELLSETGHILMADGRCPDGTWAEASKTLRDCADALLKKIDAKDAAGASAAFKGLTGSCAACHKAHKPKKKK